VLPPPGGSGGFLVPGFRGSLPARALGGGVSGGLLAGFTPQTPLTSGTLWRRYPAQLRTLPSRNPAQARTLSFRNPAHVRTLFGARWCTGDTRLRRDRGRRLRSHGGEERWLAGYRRSPPRAPTRSGALPASRRDYSPAVHATAPATVIDELYLAAGEQSGDRCCLPDRRRGRGRRSRARRPRPTRWRARPARRAAAARAHGPRCG
jgi:hypothetical protein